MMTEREFQKRLHQLTQPIPQETHRAFLRAACGKDERIVKRKLSTSLILALVLIFLTTALAFAMTNGFGILDYNATQKDNDAYVGHILGIHESYENDYVSMQVNEAVFDGVSFSLTMNISHRDGASPGEVCGRTSPGDRRGRLSGWQLAQRLLCAQPRSHHGG